MRRLAIGTGLVALSVAGCGSKEAPPFTQPQQPASQTTTAPADGGTPTSGTISGSISNLGPRYNRVFAQLVDARDALAGSAAALTAAASDAQALADRVAAGYNPPSGSAPQVVALRDALTPFSQTLHTMLTSSTQLPRLAAELQLRAAQVAKRHPRRAAALLSAKQRVDSAIAEVSGLDRALVVAQGKLREQISKVPLDGDALAAIVATANESSTKTAAKVDAAIDGGFEALIASSTP